MDSIFLKILNKEITGHIIYEDNDFFAILDIFPKQKGHTLLIPKEPKSDIFELSESILLNILKVAQKISSTLKKSLNATGIKIVQNNGKSAGQEVMHYHMHIIPYYDQKFPEKEIKDFDNIKKQIKFD